jgi:peptidoglycan/xylan/chitin deacetylase (PgdA/CDA1 family)
LVESLPAETVAQEIIDSGRKLQQQLGTPINLFCYPNGDVSAAAARLVGDHYRAAVTTQRGINRVDTPAQTLLRIGVHEDISNTPTLFNARLSGWL